MSDSRREQQGEDVEDEGSDTDLQDIPIPPTRPETIPQFILSSIFDCELDSAGNHHSAAIEEYITDGWIRDELLRRESDYATFEAISVFVGTWNINGKKGDDDVMPWLSKGSKSGSPEADIYVIGFQEMVDLTATAVMLDGMSEKASVVWKDKLLRTLNRKKDSYVLLQAKCLVGVFIAIFVKQELVQEIQGVESVNCAVGILGIMGNKGASVVRFQFRDSTLCFVCAHLAAMRGNVNARNSNYHTILEKTAFETRDESGRSLQILDHDIVIWLGDLNYRITTDVADQIIFDRCAKNDIGYLLQKDQLLLSQKAGLAFCEFTEPRISFLPTYKYEQGTDRYDQRPNKPKRAPAWCDRVLYHLHPTIDASHLSVQEYNRAQLMASDHKPVFCTMTCLVKRNNQKKMERVKEEVEASLSQYPSRKAPQVVLSCDSLTFDSVRYCQVSKQVVKVKNTGTSTARFFFINKPESHHATKPWCNVTPLNGLLFPGEVADVTVEVLVDRLTANDLNTGMDIFEDVITMRVDLGKDYFVTIKGNYFRSCFGSTLHYLVRCAKPVRESSDITSDTPIVHSVPKELWRIIDFIATNGRNEKGLFTEKGDPAEYSTIRECLDTGAEFPKAVRVQSMAQILLDFLRSLQQQVIPIRLVPTKPIEDKAMREFVSTLLDSLPSANYNALVYVASFLRHMLSFSSSNELSADLIADIFAQALIIVPDTGNAFDKSFVHFQESAASIINYLLTIPDSAFDE